MIYIFYICLEKMNFLKLLYLCKEVKTYKSKNAMNKPLWLIKLLHHNPNRFTRKEILDAWSEHDDRKRPMPVSTFYDQCAEIECVYGVKVVNEQRRYALKHCNRESADLLNFLVGEDEKLEIDGGQWIHDLHTAIKERKMTRFTYNAIGKASYTTELAPYCLHLAHGKLYVVGFSSHHSSVRTFALDRMVALTILYSRFVRPINFNAERYFCHSFGAFGGENLKPECVEMKCDEWLTNYLRQRPLHASQEEISDGCFQIHVALTQDFTCAILSFGSHVRITKPAELIQQIQDIAQEILKRYQN